MLEDKLLYLLQICDSGFPTGGFSHSLGLEAAVKAGFIHNTASLKQFICCCLENTASLKQFICCCLENTASLKQFICCCLENTGSFSLPFMREAYGLWEDVEGLSQLDRLCEACTANHVTRRASTRQGTSMLDTCVRVFQSPSLHPLVGSLPYKHQAVVFGAVCGSLGVELGAAMRAFLYSALRTVTASAVRLDKVGPIEAQSIQLEVQENIPALLNKYQDVSTDAACIVHAHVDIVQNIHDTMFTKLFYT